MNQRPGYYMSWSECLRKGIHWFLAAGIGWGIVGFCVYEAIK